MSNLGFCRLDITQSSSVTYGDTSPKGGQKLKLQNTPPRQAKPATPQEGNLAQSTPSDLILTNYNMYNRIT
ncbi:MAG: hypothetical protein RLZZ223_172 [Candidatus Parcubacteria bacterium]|jgi:hypothetical protein